MDPGTEAGRGSEDPFAAVKTSIASLLGFEVKSFRFCFEMDSSISSMVDATSFAGIA
jgi:hypothetical protein